MIEVYPKLFVGDQNDYELQVKGESNWAVVHAAKEPYHRAALGYSSRGAPKDHPEYLVARRGNRMILNIVDTNNPGFFDFRMISAALDFIDSSLDQDLEVLVHCNQGVSRSPSIAMLFLAARREAISNTSLQAAEADFKKLYPGYAPKSGIRGHIAEFWEEYIGR